MKSQASWVDLDSDNEPGPSSNPRRKRSQKRSLISNRESDEETAEPTATQRRRQGEQLPQDEEDHVIGSVLKFLFSAMATKHAIKHTDIKKYGMPNHQKHYVSLMAKVKTVLHEDFGYKLVALDEQKWMIVNALAPNQIAIRQSPTEIAEQTLLFIVLTHIFMSGELSREEQLLEFLKMLKLLREDGSAHPYFGNVQDLVSNKFIAQLYLTRTKLSAAEFEIYEYSWGPRAKEEVDPRSVLNFVSKIYGDREPTSWPHQYRSAYGETR